MITRRYNESYMEALTGGFDRVINGWLRDSEYQQSPNPTR